MVSSLGFCVRGPGLNPGSTELPTGVLQTGVWYRCHHQGVLTQEGMMLGVKINLLPWTLLETNNMTIPGSFNGLLTLNMEQL